jgi:DNA-binding protein H-NS
MSDLDELNAKEAELRKQLAEVESEKKAILDAKRNEILEVTRNNIREYGFTAQELGLKAQPKKGTSTKRNKSDKPKNSFLYRDPETGKEWRGDINQPGRKPVWVQQKIDGGTIEQCRVDPQPPSLGNH